MHNNHNTAESLPIKPISPTKPIEPSFLPFEVKYFYLLSLLAFLFGVLTYTNLMNFNYNQIILVYFIALFFFTGIPNLIILVKNKRLRNEYNLEYLKFKKSLKFYNKSLKQYNKSLKKHNKSLEKSNNSTKVPNDKLEEEQKKSVVGSVDTSNRITHKTQVTPKPLVNVSRQKRNPLHGLINNTPNSFVNTNKENDSNVNTIDWNSSKKRSPLHGIVNNTSDKINTVTKLYPTQWNSIEDHNNKKKTLLFDEILLPNKSIVEIPTPISSNSKNEEVLSTIQTYSAVCAGLAIQPIPFADIFILTPTQIIMGNKIAKIRGYNTSDVPIETILKEISGIIGLGFLAQQLAIGAYKTFLPFLGGLTTIPLVYGLTYGIGKTMDHYILAKINGQNIDRNELKKIFNSSRKIGENEGKTKEAEIRNSKVQSSFNKALEK